MRHSVYDDMPNRRLAKAFNFTADDLLANRSGVLSWRQRGVSDWLAYRLLFMLRQMPLINRWFSRGSSTKKAPHHIESVCGRIHLEHHIVDKRLIRSSLFYEYYHLIFPGHNRMFRITKPQYQALTENWRYRIYYQELGERRYILSIERMIGRCDGQKESAT